MLTVLNETRRMRGGPQDEVGTQTASGKFMTDSLKTLRSNSPVDRIIKWPLYVNNPPLLYIFSLMNLKKVEIYVY